MGRASLSEESGKKASLVLSLTEDHRADAHDGAALLDGDGVVVGHALGELAERGR